jgi:CP family cyanate transporter-like MFS transporter
MWSTVLDLSPILGELRVSFGLTYAETGLVFSTPLIILALGALAGGVMADKFGPRKIIGIGSVLIGIGGTLRSLSPDIGTFLQSTLLVGIGLSLAFPNLPKIIGISFKQDFVGTASGIYGSGIMTGGTLPLAIVIPAIYFGGLDKWRNTLLTWGVLSIAIGVIWWISLGNKKEEESSYQNSASKISFPHIVSVIKSRSLWLIAIELFLSNAVFYAESAWLISYFTSRGLATGNANFLVALFFAISIPSVLVLPFVSDKLPGRRRLMILVAGIVSALSASALTYSVLSIAWVFCLGLGISISTIFVISLVLPIDIFPKQDIGTASGTIISISYVGGLLGPSIVGYLIDTTTNLEVIPIFIVALSLSVVFLVGLWSLVSPTLTSKSATQLKS